LKASYLRRGIHLEHYEVRRADLHDLCEEFRAHFGRSDTDGEIYHYMRTKRKINKGRKNRWPTMGDVGEPKIELPELGAEHQEVLVDLYYEHLAHLGDGTDNLAYEVETTAMIETEFEHRTMRNIPGPMLVGLLTDLRKRGLLPLVDRQPKPEGGFDDINRVRA